MAIIPGPEEPSDLDPYVAPMLDDFERLGREGDTRVHVHGVDWLSARSRSAVLCAQEHEHDARWFSNLHVQQLMADAV